MLNLSTFFVLCSFSSFGIPTERQSGWRRWRWKVAVISSSRTSRMLQVVDTSPENLQPCDWGSTLAPRYLGEGHCIFDHCAESWNIRAPRTENTTWPMWKSVHSYTRWFGWESLPKGFKAELDQMDEKVLQFERELAFNITIATGASGNALSASRECRCNTRTTSSDGEKDAAWGTHSPKTKLLMNVDPPAVLWYCTGTVSDNHVCDRRAGAHASLFAVLRGDLLSAVVVLKIILLV